MGVESFYSWIGSLSGTGRDWVTLPGYFKRHGYYTTSLGKVFHRDLPANFDYPQSWSDPPIDVPKPVCPNATMACLYDDESFPDVDAYHVDQAIARLTEWQSNRSTAPFYMAVGLRPTLLPWSYPRRVAEMYGPVAAVPIAQHPTAPDKDEGELFEWFRPNEIDMYTVGNSWSRD